jgi:hypothetical protein
MGLTTGQRQQAAGRLPHLITEGGLLASVVSSSITSMIMRRLCGDSSASERSAAPVTPVSRSKASSATWSAI